MNIVVECLKILFEPKWKRRNKESESESESKEKENEFLYDPLCLGDKSVAIQDNDFVKELKNTFVAECEENCQIDKLILTKIGSGAKVVSKPTV